MDEYESLNPSSSGLPIPGCHENWNLQESRGCLNPSSSGLPIPGQQKKSAMKSVDITVLIPLLVDYPFRVFVN